MRISRLLPLLLFHSSIAALAAKGLADTEDPALLFRGSMMEGDEAQGLTPNKHPHFDFSYFTKSTTPIRTVGEADENGFRQSSSSKLPGKKKHFFLIGSAVAFGLGLKDDETLAHFLNERSRDYEVYSLAYFGFGPQHAWQRFKRGLLPKQVRFRRGRAVMFADEGSIRILWGTPKRLLFAANAPYLEEERAGVFQEKGTFASAGKWWQRALIRWCLPYQACSSLFSRLDPWPTTEQLAATGRLFDAIDEMYRSQFDVEDFQVLWRGDFSTLEAIRPFTKAKITMMPHMRAFWRGVPPSAAGSREMASYFFDHELIGGRENKIRAPAMPDGDAGLREMEWDDEAMGEVRNFHRRFTAVNYIVSRRTGGETLDNTVATADENGFRISPAARKPGKTKHFFLIDASLAYGEGLKDDETITHFINQRSREYEAYPLAYFGWAPQHAWLRFKEGRLPSQVPFHRGRAVIVMNESSFPRIWGVPGRLMWCAGFPLVQESSKGVFELKGTFALAGSWWQKALINYCSPFVFCQKLAALQDDQPTVAQLGSAGRMLDAIEMMYRQQFDVEDFRILWTGNVNTLELFRHLTKVPIVQMPMFDVGENSHPSVEGSRQIADYFFSTKVLK